jgi:DNA-binding Lrp family transcriptional regulator
LPGELANSVRPTAEARPADAAVARLVTRLSTEYLLRALHLLIDTCGEIRAGLLVQAINIANVGYTDAQAGLTRHAVIANGVFPDEMRRPVSVARLADSAGLPFENVRRVVQQLIGAGLCKRVPGGVIVPRATIERPENLRAVHANLGYARKFMRELHAVGLIDHVPACLTAAAGENGTSIARMVIRRSSEYLLRALELVADTYGDDRAGIVVQTIMSANTAYLDTRSGGGWRYAGIDEPAPDEARRPISINRIAESLGLPYETVRRQVERLLEAGVCIRVESGVIVPAAVLNRPGAVDAMLVNVGYVRKFALDLDAISV